MTFHKIQRLIIQSVCLFSLFFCTASEPTEAVPISTQLISEVRSFKPGTPFFVAVVLNHEAGWHTYWKNPGETGIPTSIDWQVPEGFTVSEIKWPVPVKFQMEGIEGIGYEGNILFLAEVLPSNELKNKDPLTIKAKIDWLACSNESCLPGNIELETTVNVSDDLPVYSEYKEAIETAKSTLPKNGISILSAKQTAESIELLLSTPEKHPLKNAEFLTSDSEICNSSSITQKDNGTISVVFKKPEDSPHNKIEGLLFFENKEESANSLIAYEVNHSFIDHSEDAIEQFEIESMSNEESSLILFIAMAFLGGMILNLMPCVLPVVSLKILNFVQLSGKNRRLSLMHGLSYSVGVLISFWALAAALLVLQAYGNSVGWGFQLQEPLFVAVLCVILLMFSLSMFGVFEMGSIIQAIAGKKMANSQKGKQGLTGSFFSGILATAVATPCTGPFLGPAIGFAVTQSPFISLLMFTSLGAGMAFPYLLLSAFPQFLRFLPKPGQWMITFKEGVAFIMLATVLWLLWVFGAETNTYALFLLLLSLFILSFACWVWGKFGALNRSRRTRLAASLFALLIAAFSVKLMLEASSIEDAPEKTVAVLDTNALALAPKDWVPFSRELLDKLVSEGKPVFIDFTARWCLICQTNHMALSTSQVDKRFEQLGVVKMKADWTKRDPSITNELKKFGRSGVPLYLFYDGKSGKPEILPQILTPETVTDYLQSGG